MIDFYNNGKVLMGSRYDENPLKPKYVEQDPDMIAIQGWLIGDCKAVKRERLAKVAYIILLVVSLVLCVIYS
jgi:hypothetical protein